MKANQKLFDFLTKAMLWILFLAALFLWLVYLSGAAHGQPPKKEYYDITGKKLKQPPAKGIYFVKVDTIVKKVIR